MIPILALFLCLFLIGTGYASSESGTVAPSGKDKCPVCGMFVYKYPGWLARMYLADGSTEFFDGAKDLFKYYFNIRKYSPHRSRKDTRTILVMEYYGMDFLDARKAFFVIGSDVYGPMGHELIPLANLEDARTFMKDHKGKRILTFGEITPAVISTLD